MSRVSWSVEEDQAISQLVKENGIEDWTKIAYKLRDFIGIQKRTGKQCRQRWYNHLSPSVNKQPWTQQEEELLFTHHKHYGNRWKDISKFFKGRTDNDIKNHFYSTLRRSLRRLNKIVGQKNSTTQMREIKPSVLSTIMNYIYQQQHPETQLVESLKDLPILIFEFAKFKPVKLNIKNANIESIKEQTNEIFTLINQFNQQYEQNKEFRKTLKSEKKLKRLVMNRLGSACSDASVKMEEEFLHRSQQVYVKEEQDEQQYVKIEEPCQGHVYHHDHKYIDKTEFSLNHGPFDSYHEEFLPLDIMNHIGSASKATIKQAHVPQSQQKRRFSLQADEIHDMHFNEPQEPSRMLIEENAQFELHQDDPEDKERDQDGLELIDEVIETHFDR